MTSSDGAEEALATYGTLAPGRPNHHQLDGLSGAWSRGTVRGQLFESGWGAALGYPGLVLDENGPRVAVDLFTSPDLSAHWERLDAFEGEGYRRVLVQVNCSDGVRNAWIYVLAQVSPSAS